MSELTVNVEGLKIGDYTAEDLKKRLTRLGVEYPERRQKAFYFDLYKETLLKLQNKDASPTPVVASRTSLTKKRRRRREQSEEDADNNTQEYQEGTQDSMVDEEQSQSTLDLNDENNEEEPPKKKSKQESVEDKPTSPQQVVVTEVTETVTVLAPVETEPQPTNLPEQFPVIEVTPAPQKPSDILDRRRTVAPSYADQQQTRVGEIRRRTVGTLHPSLHEKITDSYSPVQNRDHATPETPQSVRELLSPSSLKQGRLSILSNRSGISTITDMSAMTNEVEQSFSERKFITGTLAAIFWLLLVAVAYVFVFRGINDPSKPHGLPYCSTEVDGSIIANQSPGVVRHFNDDIIQDPLCQPCPVDGYCSQGRLIQCKPPLVISNAICVVPEEVTQTAMQMITYLQRSLADRAGSAECGNPIEKYQVLSAVREELQAAFPVKEALFEQSFAKMLEVIGGSSQNLELVITDVTYNTTDGVEVTGQAIYSTIATLSIVCRSQKLIKKNLVGISIISVLILVAIIGSIIRSRKEVYDRNTREVIQSAITALRTNKSSLSVHLRDELRDAFAGKFDLTDEMWEDVSERLRSDSRIEESNTVQGLQWAWTSNIDVVDVVGL